MISFRHEMQMTPKYHWNRILVSIGNGIFCGIAVDLVLGGVGALLSLIPGFPDPPHWAQALLACGFVGIPLVFPIVLAYAEACDQLEEYRTATNQCRYCGYSLRGTRKISDKCPECGELFKKFL